MSEGPKPQEQVSGTKLVIDNPMPLTIDVPRPFEPPSFEVFKGSLPSFLYHYTSPDGLLGIVEHSELWATNLNYMNDATEFQISLKLAEETLTAATNSSALNPQRREIACVLIKEVAHIEERGICAICFCSDGDLLSQWRGYSGRGYGFSIGFNPNVLKSFGEITRSDIAPFELAKCIYDENLQRKIVEEICEFYLDPNISLHHR
jgi:hypothetical protein